MSAKKTKKGISSATARQISNSLAYLVVNTTRANGEEQPDMIATLSELGFGKKTIATVLHADPLEVSARLGELKAARKKSKAESNGEEQEEAS